MEEINNKEEIKLRPIIINYLLHWKLILGTGIVAVLLGVLYLIFYPKSFETVARVQIQDENSLSGGGSVLGEAAGIMKSFGLGGGTSNGIVIDDEIATFSSNSLLSKMVHELGLYAEYIKPYSFNYKLYEDKPMRLIVDSATIVQLEKGINFNISVSPNNIKIKAKIKADKWKETFQFTSLPATVKLKYGEFTFDHTDIGREKGSYKINIKIRSLTSVADDLSDGLLIEELSKTSSIIEFFTVDYKTQRSRDIFNSLIKLYNIHAVKYRNELGQKSMSFLDGRINNLLNELSDIENTIAAYKNQHKITRTDADIQYYTQSMKDLQGRIIEAEAQSHIIKLMKAFVNDTTNRHRLVPPLLATGSNFENTPLTQYNGALLERERIIQNSGADNPMLTPLTLRIDKLRESVSQMIENENQSSQLIINELKEKEKSIMSRMSAVPEQEKMYLDYKRQQEIIQGVYLILLQKREEIALSIGQSKEKARVIDPAFTKPRSVAPRKLYAAIFIVIFTLGISIGFLFIKNNIQSFISDLKNYNK